MTELSRQDIPRRAIEMPAARDISGFRIFAAGEAGAAHVIAHRLADRNLPGRGRRYLGDWLRTHQGAGSEWVHLQFHMALFELASGDWDAAHWRCRRHVLPAVPAGDALTDAPELLWRLKLHAPGPVALPWQAVRVAALDRLKRPSDPFTALHNLLALAGAGDQVNLQRRARALGRQQPAPAMHIAARLGIALVAMGEGRYEAAAAIIAKARPRLALVGGSNAQNELWEEIRRHCLAGRTAEPQPFVQALAA